MNIILNSSLFSEVKIGTLGQLFWENAAEMKDEKGNVLKCEYDMSPEFVYHHSVYLK